MTATRTSVEDGRSSMKDNELAFIDIEEDKQLEQDEVHPNELQEILKNQAGISEIDNSDDDQEDKDIENEEITSNSYEESNNTDDKEENEDDDGFTRTRTGRISKPPTRINLYKCHLITQAHARQEYSIKSAKDIATSIIGYKNKQHHQFMETCSLKEGLKQFE